MGEIYDLARDVIEIAAHKAIKIVTAESCTGGMVGAALTDIAGSSSVFDRGFITYSNDAKAQMLGVDPALILRDGAVSETVARAMADGALRYSNASLSIAITGIAGPGGGSASKPVGLVHFASARKGAATEHAMKQFGDLGRESVRHAALLHALHMLRARMTED